MSFIYLGSPYTDKSELVMHHRFLHVCKLTAGYLRQGIHVYSPIAHCHPIAQLHKLPRDFAFWQEYNFAMLEKSDRMLVIQMEGWENSKGLKSEIQYCTKHNIPITMVPTIESPHA